MINWPDIDEPWPPYFGYWDAPIVDGGFQVDTPVGMKCIWCEEEIEEGDNGTFTLTGLIGGVDKILINNNEVSPQHIECSLRSTLGGLNHLKGTCSCQGGPDQPDQEGLTKREAALEVWEWVQSQKAKRSS